MISMKSKKILILLKKTERKNSIMKSKKEKNKKNYPKLIIGAILIIGFVALIGYAVVDALHTPSESETVSGDNVSMYLKFEGGQMSGYEIIDDEGNLIDSGDGQAPAETDNDSDEEGIIYYDENGNVVDFQEGEFDFYDSEGELIK